MNEAAKVSGPIGVFDSGVGGLSILREIRRQMPAEDLLFYADSGYCPYGTKTPEEVRARTFAIADFLLAQREGDSPLEPAPRSVALPSARGAKALVVACNTATAAALEPLRERFCSAGETPAVPVVGVEPAMKPAAAATKTGRVGVLATPGTLQGERYHSLLDRFGEGLTVYSEACPEFVPLVEAGTVDGPEAEAAVRRHVAPLLADGVDVIVLGCTHYPFLRPVVERVCGPGVTVIDTAAAVARQTRHVLEVRRLLRTGTLPGSVTFFTSGDAQVVGVVIRTLWGETGATVLYAGV